MYFSTYFQNLVSKFFFHQFELDYVNCHLLDKLQIILLIYENQLSKGFFEFETSRRHELLGQLPTESKGLHRRERPLLGAAPPY